MIGRSMPRRRMTSRVATRPGGKLGSAAAPAPGSVIGPNGVGSGSYEARARASGAGCTAVVYVMRPLASSARPTAVSTAGRRRPRRRGAGVSTGAKLASVAGAPGRRTQPYFGRAGRPGVALPADGARGLADDVEERPRDQ